MAGLWLVPATLVLAVFGVIFTVLVVEHVTSYTDAGPYTLQSRACTQADGVVTFQGTVRNDGAKRRDYVLSVTYHDANRRLLSGDLVRVRRVSPGEVAPWRIERRDVPSTATCEVDDVWNRVPLGR